MFRLALLVGAIGVVFIAWIAFCVYQESGRKERELKRQGFHIEFLSEGILRGGPGEILIVYHDVRGKCWFGGKMIGGKATVKMSESPFWEKSVPPWAKSERQVIIDRIRKALPRVVIQ